VPCPPNILRHHREVGRPSPGRGYALFLTTQEILEKGLLGCATRKRLLASGWWASGSVQAVLRHQILEGLAVVEAGKRIVGYVNLEEVTQRLPALPNLVDQQPVAGSKRASAI
jgi:hypothetical protein